MNVNHSENTKDNEESTNTHPFTLRLVIVFAGVLIALPLLPGLITNLAYSFSGHAPKIYWYLSRASGFISLTILWVSMAMGLGLTNKLARRWPGAPAAFAIHEYVSLLGLLFAVYHGLVLMGDHYVDFSLPRLLIPFSIKYEPFWTGLGQAAFYTWIIVLLSFYVRQFIGQKTWRMIHYANFAIYMMGVLHGLFSGTDGTTSWAHWYYGISAGTLIALLVYRVYITVHKKTASRPIPAVRPANSSPTPAQATTIDAPVSAVGGKVSQKPALEQALVPLGFQAPKEQPVAAPEPVTVPTAPEPEVVPQFLSIEEEQVPASEYVIAETQLPIVEQGPVTLKIFAEVPIPPADPDSLIKKDLCQDQVQVPAYLEPVTARSLRTNGIERSIQTQTAEEWEKVVIPDIRIHVGEPSKQTNPNPSPLILRIKQHLPKKPTQPLIIRRRKREGIPET